MFDQVKSFSVTFHGIVKDMEVKHLRRFLPEVNEAGTDQDSDPWCA